jgi:hopanoid biosynthesis associated protein HpnK
MKRVIINADDFGLTGGINQAVLRGYRDGVLTSATILVNAPATQEAVSIAKENPGLGVGIHLNILRGKPVLPPAQVPTLVDAGGRFLKSVPRLMGRLVRRKIATSEITDEFSAQIKRGLEYGVEITHLDSERHLHSIFIGAAIEAGLRHGIRKMRMSCEPPTVSSRGCISAQFFKTLALNLLWRRNRRALRRNNIVSPDHFFGLQHSGRMTPQRLKATLLRLPDGVSEIMLHPGYIRVEVEKLKPEFGRYDFTPDYEREIEALLSPYVREVITRNGIQLISYREIKSL